MLVQPLVGKAGCQRGKAEERHHRNTAPAAHRNLQHIAENQGNASADSIRDHHHQICLCSGISPNIGIDSENTTCQHQNDIKEQRVMHERKRVRCVSQQDQTQNNGVRKGKADRIHRNQQPFSAIQQQPKQCRHVPFTFMFQQQYLLFIKSPVFYDMRHNNYIHIIIHHSTHFVKRGAYPCFGYAPALYLIRLTVSLPNSAAGNASSR